MSIEHLLTRPVSALPLNATCAEAARRMRRQNKALLRAEASRLEAGDASAE